jgi:ubiquinol-cytochrome c reductase iron-sulfur subunit
MSEQAPTQLGELAEDDPRLQPGARSPRRVERIIAVSLLISIAGFVGLAILYSLGGQPQAEGSLLGVGLFALGFASTAWGKYLMPRGPFVEARHQMSSPERERREFAGAFLRGGRSINRRSALGKLMGLAAAAFGAVLIFPLRSLGPQPKKILDATDWRPGSRLVRDNGRPVKVGDLDVGGILTVFPEDIFRGGGPSDTQLQVDMTVLLRVATQPVVTQPGRETWSPHGYLAFSKMCTHAGCPVGLYEEETQQLMCPCHQSLFDILDGAKPVFGPAPRPLPQLPLMVDQSGHLRAQRGYDEPVGPGFWERM